MARIHSSNHDDGSGPSSFARAQKKGLAQAPDYRSRGNQTRLFGLILALFVVSWLAQLARDPAMWKWLWLAKDGPQAPQVVEPKSEQVYDEDGTEYRPLDLQAPEIQSAHGDPSTSKDAGDASSRSRDVAEVENRAERLALDDVISGLTRQERGSLIHLWMKQGRQRGVRRRVAAPSYESGAVASPTLGTSKQLLHRLDELFAAHFAKARSSIEALSERERERWSKVIQAVENRWNQVARVAVSESLLGRSVDERQFQALATIGEQSYRKELDQVRDERIFLKEDYEAWFATLSLLDQPPEGFRFGEPRKLSDAQMRQQTKAYRGARVTLSGEIGLAYELTAPENSVGIRTYWVYWIWIANGPPSPVVVYALEKPPSDFPIGDSVDPKWNRLDARRSATFDAILFKNWAYASQGGPATTLLFLSKGPRFSGASETPPPTKSLFGSAPWIELTIVLGATAIMIGWVYQRFRVRIRPWPSTVPTPKGYANVDDEPTTREQVDRDTERRSVPAPPVPDSTPAPRSIANHIGPASKTSGFLLFVAMALGQNVFSQESSLPWEKKPPASNNDALSLKQILSERGFENEGWASLADPDATPELKRESRLRLVSQIDRIHAVTLQSLLEKRAWPATMHELASIQGTVVSVEGWITRVTPIPLNEEERNKHNRDSVWMADFESAMEERPLRLFLSSIPKRFRDAQSELRERVRLNAVVLGAESTPEGSLVFELVGQRLGWRPDEQSLLATMMERELATAGMDIDRFEDIADRNRGPLDNADRECFYQLLAAAPRLPWDTTETENLPRLDIVESIQDSRSLVGKAFRVKGELRQLRRVAVTDPEIHNRLGLREYYECDLLVPLGDRQISMVDPQDPTFKHAYVNTFPVTICTVDSPGVPESDTLKLSIEFVGVYFKMWSFQSGDKALRDRNRPQICPLLIAHSVLKTRAIPEDTSFSSMMWGVVGALVVSCLAVLYWVATERKASTRFGRSLPDRLEHSV